MRRSAPPRSRRSPAGGRRPRPRPRGPRRRRGVVHGRPRREALVGFGLAAQRPAELGRGFTRAEQGAGEHGVRPDAVGGEAGAQRPCGLPAAAVSGRRSSGSPGAASAWRTRVEAQRPRKSTVRLRPAASYARLHSPRGDLPLRRLRRLHRHRRSPGTSSRSSPNRGRSRRTGSSRSRARSTSRRPSSFTRGPVTRTPGSGSLRPRSRLPFAGHPTLGTAFVLGGPLQLEVIRLETGHGIVPDCSSGRALGSSSGG